MLRKSEVYHLKNTFCSHNLLITCLLSLLLSSIHPNCHARPLSVCLQTTIPLLSLTLSHTHSLFLQYKHHFSLYFHSLSPPCSLSSLFSVPPTAQPCHSANIQNENKTELQQRTHQTLKLFCLNKLHQVRKTKSSSTRKGTFSFAVNYRVQIVMLNMVRIG